MADHQYSLAELAELLSVKYVGDAELVISGLATLANAGAGQLSFLANPKYKKALATTRAEAVIVAADMEGVGPANRLISDNPYLTYAKASQLFAASSLPQTGIHPSAVISPSASIDPSAYIGANVTIAEHAVIGAATVINAGCVIGNNTVLGEACLLHANVSLYHDVSLGNRVIVHSNTVIGSDGFGFAPSPDRDQGGWVKIAQLGGVVVGDDVEIGAGCTIDRGALDDTRIGDRVILDNQIQIAHNVELGVNTAIAGCVAIAGSTKVGKNCTIAGGAAITGHLTIADSVHITAFTLVTKSIAKAGTYSSGTPMQENRIWRRNAVRFSQLDEIAKRLSDLENKVD
ncbi:UDP-3-O-(3-hydroxymyristoyl)glucosamine N-acyltransferase [uncultured Oceanicoccus sp.]|uniref:UDP-3-O-(3-hydroxymyristoyl)glucosamine N-acyltransferase n=1 Tax=uncultured Oceanicoccus sp. TaxID=1706381 RepID=UPI0030D8DEE9